MWSETVGLRTRPVTDQKIGLGLNFDSLVHYGLGLAGLVLCCQTQSCHDLVHVLKKTATFQVIFIVSLFCAWNININCEDQQCFTYLKVKSAKFLCLLLVPWSWSYEFGLV